MKTRAAIFVLLLATGGALHAENFVAPYSGTLYMQCVGGSAGASSEFGLGTSPSNFVPYLTGLPASCPDTEVSVGAVTGGQTVQFGISTAWNGQTYWAFSSGSDQGSIVSFSDVCNTLGMGGNIIQQTASTTWVMHLNDAAHYTLSQCEENNIMIQLRLASSQTTPPSTDVLINFEPPLPSGLVAMSFWEDTPVTLQSKITNQYGNLGVLMSNVALVNLGTGQAYSGTNGIAPISSTGTIDYGSAATFTFVDPANNHSPATTDYFAISTDRWGGSGNTTTVSSYDINGKLLGSVSSPDLGGVTLQLQNIGQMHSVVAQSTLINHSSGGVALDNVQFGAISTSPPPASGSMPQVASGGGWQTTFTLVNTGTSSSQAQLSFFDDSGNTLSLPLTLVESGTTTTDSSITETIPAGGTLEILTQGNNTLASIGSAQLASTSSVGGFAIFHYNPTGQEAVVPMQTSNATAYVLAFDNTNGLSTGLALANVSSQSANVPVIVRDDTGAQLGTSTINLPAHGHTSFVLANIYPSVAGKMGTMELDTPTGGQISVLGLRVTPGGALTTIPVLAK